MHLGGGFASTVFRPIHAVGDKLHNRRIHRVDFDLEPPQHSLAFATRSKIRAGMLEMIEHRPEEFFDKIRTTLFVRVRQAVLGWRSDSKSLQGRRLETQPITNIV